MIYGQSAEPSFNADGESGVHRNKRIERAWSPSCMSNAIRSASTESSLLELGIIFTWLSQGIHRHIIHTHVRCDLRAQQCWGRPLVYSQSENIKLVRVDADVLRDNEKGCLRTLGADGADGVSAYFAWVRASVWPVAQSRRIAMRNL